ncbi:MAG: molecular chaperone DnaK [Parcubacteria group bacterium]|nr:molecular chaperone DnaK [Parcubacteria group bacterium]
MPKIIGIDLGTTLSEMAVMEGGKPTIIPNREGSRLTPSVVAITKNGERVVGQIARRQAITNPKNTLFSVKRLIGRRFDDPQVERDRKWLPYDIRKSEKGEGVEVKMGDRWYAPQEISAMVLAKLKADAEEYLGDKVEEAIITVPAYFDDSQRQATKDAGQIAGLKVRRVLNEPTAAALAYGLDKNKNERILIYDLGGGTFDVSILEVGDNTIEVKATNGDTHLGGDDFDQRIINWITAEFKKETGIDLGKDQLALQRLKEAAEKAKHELSTTLETEINQPFITTDAEGPKHLLLKLTRVQLENLVGDLIDRTFEPVTIALTDAKLTPKDIDQVVLVGGQTRMPAIQARVEDYFGKKANKTINPDEVVAVGAAVEAGVLTGEVKDILLLDVTPLSLSIETLGGVATKMIEKNTTIPTSRTQVFSTAADSQTSVEIKIYQGEREFAADNKLLGTFVLDGIPPAPRGLPQIEVTYDIDANGILNVSAKDKATGKEQKITIKASAGLSKEEIARMEKEAASHAAEDHKRKERVEAANTADTLIYTAEKTLKEAGDKVAADAKKTVENKIEELKKIKNEGTTEEIKLAMDALSAELQKVGAELYRAAQQKPGANPDDTKPKDEGPVKEGEVEK